jgi:hypothetical protein
VLVPYIQNGAEGDYLPVVVSNSGDITLHNLLIGIRSCPMEENESFETFEVPYILPNKEFILRFGNNKTIQSFKRMWCTPSSVYPYPSINFSISHYNVTSKMDTMTTCGYCLYEVVVHSDEFDKTINGSYKAPIDVTMSVSVLSNTFP